MFVFVGVYLPRFRFGVFADALIKLFVAHGLSEIVRIGNAVYGVVKADIADVAFFEMFFCEVCRGAAT